jgi:hypothetical protein
MKSDIVIEESIEPTIKLLVDNDIQIKDYPNLSSEMINYIGRFAEEYVRENKFNYNVNEYTCGIALKQAFKIMNEILYCKLDNECYHYLRLLDSALKKVGLGIDTQKLKNYGSIDIIKASREYPGKFEYNPGPNQYE